MAQRSLNRRSRRDDIEEDEYDGPDTDSQDNDEDEPPRRGRGRSRREEPEEAPRGRRSRREEPDDEDEDDEEDKPRSRRGNRDSFEKGSDEGRGRSQRPSSNASGKGWGGYKSVRQETSDYVKNYSLPEAQAELIKFLDAEPFLVYNEHWIDEARKKSWACIGEDCPLCNTGDKPKTYALFNVIDLREGEEPKVAPLKASPMVTDLLEEFAKDKKTAPLNREDQYFSVQKKGGGKKGRVQVIVNPVKARDLKEDWDVDPLSEAEIEDYMADMYAEDDVLEFPSRKSLKAVADELD